MKITIPPAKGYLPVPLIFFNISMAKVKRCLCVQLIKQGCSTFVQQKLLKIAVFQKKLPIGLAFTSFEG